MDVLTRPHLLPQLSPARQIGLPVEISAPPSDRNPRSFGMGIVVAFVVGLLAVTSCDLSDPVTSPSPSDDVDGGGLGVALECSSDFFLFGPRKLAANYGLNSFDPKQVAYTWATGHFIRDEAAQAACSSAFAFAEDHYLYAGSLGWLPYRSQDLWLWRWHAR